MSRAPAVVEPIAVPVPPVTVPVEVRNVEVAGVAVDGSPEEDALDLPSLWDKFLVRQQVIQNVGVEHSNVNQLLVELVPLDYPVPLAIREIQRNPRRIPRELATPAMLLNFPTSGNVRSDIAVDDVIHFHPPCVFCPPAI